MSTKFVNSNISTCATSNKIDISPSFAEQKKKITHLQKEMLIIFSSDVYFLGTLYWILIVIWWHIICLILSRTTPSYMTREKKTKMWLVFFFFIFIKSNFINFDWRLMLKRKNNFDFLGQQSERTQMEWMLFLTFLAISSHEFLHFFISIFVFF